jgi:flagellar motor switch protein FliN/FliY
MAESSEQSDPAQGGEAASAEQPQSEAAEQPAGQGGQPQGDAAGVEDGLAQAQSSVNEMRESVAEATGGEPAAGAGPEASTPATGESGDSSEAPQPPGEATAADGAGDPAAVSMPDFSASGSRADRGIELLGDVDLDVSVELGRSEMLVEDVLGLGSGSVVELDKLAGDPVDVYVNGRLVARGEVLVLNDNFCIRVSEIVADLEEEADLAQQQQGQS